MTDAQIAYILAWVDSVIASGFRAGIYCSGMPAKEGKGKTVVTADDIRAQARERRIVYFVYNDACPPSMAAHTRKTSCALGKRCRVRSDLAIRPIATTPGIHEAMRSNLQFRWKLLRAGFGPGFCYSRRSRFGHSRPIHRAAAIEMRERRTRSDECTSESQGKNLDDRFMNDAIEGMQMSGTTTDKEPNALEVENIVKVYRGRRGGLFGEASEPVRAIDGLSFNVPRGTIFGLLGPNGAGKTTLLKILATLLQPTSGHARIEGFDVVEEPLEVRRRISMVLQETAGEVFLSVRDNLMTYARFHSLAKPDAERRATEIMRLFDLTAEADRKVQDLSGGFRRRVQVAKVFLVNTPVLFLDEFSTGMDPILKRAVMDSLRQEAARGRTIVLDDANFERGGRVVRRHSDSQ